MSEDETSPGVIVPPTAAAAAPPRPAAPPAARSRAWLGLLLGAVALAAAWLFWQTWNGARDAQRAAQDERAQLGARVEALGRSAEQARRDGDGLRARLDDAAKVNESLRAQLLSLGERARLVEDAVANLADRRLSGHDALLLNEAEMLLALGAERLALFHDSNAAIDAYRLADVALSAVDDAAFSTVRQSISAETEALSALHAADTPAALGQLQALRTAAAQLPAPTRELPEGNAGESRWARLLGQFIRVRHGDDVTTAAQRHDIVLARQLFVLDLRDAQAALLARDGAQFHAALDDARAVLGADFDAASAATTAAHANLAALAKLVVAPPAPANLGAALRELRNLRATHMLQPPANAAAAPKPAEERP
jgi:uroporphyrin-3 C-methyltransferase